MISLLYVVENDEDAYWLKNLSLLLLNVTITETRKNKNMGKTGLYGMSPCWGSTVTYFSFYEVSKNN